MDESLPSSKKRKIDEVTTTSTSSTLTSKIKIRLANASILGIILSSSSLIKEDEKETFYVRNARRRVYRFLKNYVVAKRGKIENNERHPSSPPLNKNNRSSFTWLPKLLLLENSPLLREASSKFFLETLRTKENESVLVEQACAILTENLNSSKSCSELLTYVCNIISGKSGMVQYIARSNRRLVEAFFSHLRTLVDELVGNDLECVQSMESAVNSLSVTLLFISLLLSEPNLRESFEKLSLHEIARLSANLEVLQIGSVLTLDCSSKLKDISCSILKTPELVVTSTGHALGYFSSRLKKNYSQCFPYVIGSLVVINDVVNSVVPKSKVPDVNIQLQRAPTQEEYFRSGLTKSTISLTDIPTASENDGPTVQDLKSKIASELGMSTSLEMFELVVANKIISSELDLVQVFEQIWKPHIEERSIQKANSASQLRRLPAVAGSNTIVSANHPNEFASLPGILYRSSFAPRFDDISGLLTSQAVDDDDDGDDDDEGEESSTFQQHNVAEDDDDDESSSGVFVRSLPSGKRSSLNVNFPPMLITYRLCAVDGEATEDFISSLAKNTNSEDKKEFFSATQRYGDEGLKSLISIIKFSVENLREWPFPIARDLLMGSLTALEQTLTFNMNRLVKLGAIPVLLRCLVLSGDAASNLCLTILDRLVSDDANSGEFEQDDNSISVDHLDWVLERLDTSQQPKLISALSKLVPHLIHGRIEKAKLLALKLKENLDKQWALSVIENLSSTSRDVTLLRNALFELELTKTCRQQLGESCPENFLEHAGLETTLKSLRMLKGLLKNHLQSCQLICQSASLNTIVRLEEISSTKVENVGAYAYAVLEVLSSSPFEEIKQEVLTCQKQRKEELRAVAAKKRSRAIKTLKATAAAPAAASTPTGSSTKKQRRWVEEMTSLEEEDKDLICIVCHEGYRSKPSQLLCAYSYCKAVIMAQGCNFVTSSGQNRVTLTNSSWCISSSSSFVCIHQTCHESAAKADRGHPKAPKDEWEGAEIRNGHVKCNNLIPLRGTVPIPVYESAIHAYFERIDRDTKVKISSASFSLDPSLISIIAHDIRLVLLRAAFGESFSDDTNGGSVESNLKLLVPLLQMGFHLLKSDSVQRSNVEANLVSYLSKPNECDYGFACVLAIFFLTPEKWEELRLDWFLPVLVSHANRVQANALAGDVASVGSGVNNNLVLRARSRSRSKSAVEESDDYIPKFVRPWLVFFGLINNIFSQSQKDATDKAFLESVQSLADYSRVVQNSSHSIRAISETLNFSPEMVKKCLSLL